MIWDVDRRALTLARDPSGQRPLFYHSTDRRLTAGSFPRAIYALGDIDRRVDPLKIIDGLSQLDVDVERSHFEDVRAVAPGGIVTVTSDNFEARKWYDMRNRLRQVRYASDNDYVEAAREHLDTAVRACLRSEGAVGSFLSGGSIRRSWPA